MNRRFARSAWIDNTNRELLDEQAIVLMEGMPGDDLDALTSQARGVVDHDANGIPERPVFFSLTPSSPTVTGGSFSGADIFFSLNGAAPVPFATAEDIGLVAGDDIDAMCLMKAGLPNTELRPGSTPVVVTPPVGALAIDHVVFSLASGSPSLSTLGVGPGDLLISDFANSRISISAQPQLYATAEALGLDGGDNLNALKCMTSAAIVEIDGDGVGLQDAKGVWGWACGIGGTAGRAGRSGLVLINVTNPGAPVPDPTVLPQNRPMPGQPGFYEVWAIRNEVAPDFHGPYAIPGSSVAQLGVLPELEPSSLDRGINQGDNCAPHHLHVFSFEGHDDPDGSRCGHGKQVQYFGAVVEIPFGATPRDILRLALEAFVQSQVPVAQHVHGNWHAYDGPSLNPMPIQRCAPNGLPNASGLESVASGAPAGESVSERGLLIFTGTGRTKLEVQIVGADGIRVSPVETNAPLPLVVPEPGLLSGAAACTLSLVALRRCRKRRD